MNSMRVLLTVAAFAISGCAAMIAPSAAERATADYGAYPTNYKEIVQAHLRRMLIDPNSAQDLQMSPPAKYFVQEPPIAGGRTLYGYRVWFSVNATAIP